MALYAIYDTQTKRLFSVGEAGVLAPDSVLAANGRTKKEVTGASLTNYSAGGVWNESTLAFDARPFAMTVERNEFLDLFSAAEQEAVIGTTNATVQVFLQKLSLSERVRLHHERTITAVNGLEALGLIGTGRAAQILAGQAPS